MNSALVLSSILLWMVVLFNLLLTIALIRKSSAPQPGFDMAHIPTLEVGSQAPEFTAETLDGENVTLADYLGKNVAFIFMSPTCSPCIEKIPAINELAPGAKSSGVELVLIMLADLVEVKKFVDQYSVRVPIIVAPRISNPLADNYKVSGTPFYCLLSRDQKVQSIGLFGSRDDLTKQWLSPNNIN